jgi:ATP-binding cassette subfamily F protein 3
LRLKFPPAPRSGAYPIILENGSKSYGNHLVFEKATLTINRGEKVAFVGKNGEGKSTLVKCIMGQIPYEGKLQLGHNVKIGYFAQNQADLMNEKLSVFETIDYVAVGDVRTKIRDILGAFMFGGEASDKKVAVLSGGERTRLSMIKLLLEPVNLLILDEPTNHLDMRSKDVLKEALKEFDGTAIIVSHDREFLDGLVDKVYEFGNQHIREHLGGIYEFLEKKKIETLQDLEKKTPANKPAEPRPENKKTQPVKPSYEQRKEQQRILNRLEKNVACCETKIEKLESEIKEMEQILNTPEGASNVDLLWKHADSQKEMTKTMNEWTEATIALEDFKNQ